MLNSFSQSRSYSGERRRPSSSTSSVEISLGLESTEERDQQNINRQFVHFCIDIEKEIHLERLAGTTGKATRSQENW